VAVRVVLRVKVATRGLAVASAVQSTTDQVERCRLLEWEVGVGKEEQMEVEA
jgi:hypothetical protein